MEEKGSSPRSTGSIGNYPLEGNKVQERKKSPAEE